MARRLKLSTEWVIYLYCLCREGERSVDAALMASWAELQAYYGADKVGALTRAVGKLGRLAQGVTPVPQPLYHDVWRSIGSPASLLGSWLTRCASRWKTTWHFRPQEIFYLSTTLQTLIDTLRRDERPGPEDLIALRMGLHLCQVVIDTRCPGLPELARAIRIEHFNQSLCIVPVKIADLIKPSVVGQNQSVTATVKDHS